MRYLEIAFAAIIIVVIIGAFAALCNTQLIEQALYLTSALTIFGWIVLVWLGAIEVRKSHANALAAQKQLLQEQIRITLYQEVVPLIAKAKTASIKLNVRISGFPGHHWRSTQTGRMQAIEGRGLDIENSTNKELDNAVEAVSEVASHIEVFKGAYGPLGTLSTVLSSASSDLQEKGYEALDVLEHAVISDEYQSDPDFADTAQKVLKEARDINLKIYGYLVDVLAECHDYFLASIMEGEYHERRKPRDSRFPLLKPREATEREPP